MLVAKRASSIGKDILPRQGTKKVCGIAQKGKDAFIMKRSSKGMES